MTFSQRIEMKQSILTNSEKKISDTIFKNPDYVLRANTISELSKKCKVSQPTLSRYLQKLDYSNFYDFKRDVYLISKEDNKDKQKHELTKLEAYIDVISKIPNFVDDELLIEVGKMILDARNIYTIGYHKSFLSAKMMHYNLLKFSLTSLPFNFDNVFELNSLANQQDVAILFSATGETVKEVVQNLHEKNTKIILITNNQKISYKKLVDKIIWLPNSKNQHLPIYLENQIVFMVFGDLLISQIANLI